MARLIEIKCPKCSAPVPIDADATSVTCRYCGGTSVIERAQTTRTPAATPAATPRTVAPAAPLNGLRNLVFGVIAIGAVGGVGSLALKLANNAAPGGGGQGIASMLGGSSLHFSDRPMLADVNGDGVLDVLGKVRGPNSTDMLASFDGNTGTELWRSAPLTKDAAEGGSLRGVLLGRFIAVDALGKVQAYDLRTGNPSWSALLGEKARSICEGAGIIVIETDDDVRHGLDPATGKKRELAKDAPCAPVFSNERDIAPGYRIVGWTDFKKLGLPEMSGIEGMTVHRALVPNGPGPRFMLGQREKGTAVAMVAAVDGKKVLWKDIVPGVDPLTTSVNSLGIEAALIDGKLLVPYALKENNTGMRLACFSVATGERLWDVQALPKDDKLHGLAVAPGRVFMTSWFDAAVALSLETGEVQYQLGGK